MQNLGESYPKLWKYLGLRNLLTVIEKEALKEDLYTSAAVRYTAAQTTYENWKMQQKHTKSTQSLAKTRSRAEVTRPMLARIKYERSLAATLYAHDYDESNLLIPGIHVFGQYDSNNNGMQKLQQMQDLCTSCGMTPADELNQQNLAVLQTFGFADEEPKKKLIVYLGT